MSTPIENNTTELRAILSAVNSLPSADAGKPVIEPLEVTDNGTYTAPEGVDGYSPVTVNVTGGGGTTVITSPKAVNFRDYDGALLYSYTTEEALELAEMPTPPEHEGLICQGWNWSLSDMKSYVSECKICEIGSLYITDDGSTRIYITLQEGRTSPVLILALDGTVTVDWGDGTAPETISGYSLAEYVGTQAHDYARAGDYVIKLTVNSGTIACAVPVGNPPLESTAYACSVKKVELGSAFEIGEYAFGDLLHLTSVTIPRGVTYINTYAFMGCGLTSVNVPDSVTSIGDSAFSSCNSLKHVSLPSYVSLEGYVIFGGGNQVERFIVPHGNETLGTAFDTYQVHPSLVAIPGSVNTISEDAFAQLSALKEVFIGYGVTNIDSGAFEGCGLQRVTLPDSVTHIGSSAFRYCRAMTNLVLSEALETIGSSAFENCYPLSTISFPASILSIGWDAFSGCIVMKVYDFSRCTSIPTIENMCFDFAQDTEIHVPAALVNEWKAATNWASYADIIVGV